IPPELGSSIEVRAQARGELQPGAPSGRVFVELGYTDLAAWRPWIDYPLNLREGQGALRVWATLERGALKEATADIALADVTASLADELSPLELVSMRGRVFGRSLPDGVEISGRGLALVAAGGPQIPQTDFQIVWRPQAGGVLAASALDLQAIADLVESLPLPPQISGLLDELAPRGRLSQARLEWSGPFDAPTRFEARARFADLAMRARDAVPGFSGLSGSVEATHERGKLTLSSSKAALELPRVFPEARIPLDTLAGQLDWERAKGVAVRVSSLSFANDHASGNLFGSYAWTGEGPGTLDLSAVLNRADGRYAERYLPHVLPPQARHWLSNAIVAGEANDVRVRVRGDLRQFPFVDPASGVFQVTARVEKGVLDYGRGWPRINDITADLTFERDRMEIVGRSASVLGAQLANVRVAIPSLRSDQRRVLVAGQADGPSAEFLRFLGASPLREATSFAAGMSASGRGRLHLQLELPLAALDRSKVRGEYEFANNQVSVLQWLPPVDAAAGKLTFTESSFTLHDVRGRLFNGQVAVSGGTRGKGRVDVIARGSASAEAARVLFDHPLTQQLTGTVPYVVTVRAQDGLASVVFESPLRGLASSLPAPLDKAAADTLPLRVDVRPQAGGTRDTVSVALGTLARVEVARRRENEDMVAIRTGLWFSPGRGAVRLPERGVLAYGALAALDLDRWLPFVPAAGSSSAKAPPVAFDMRFGTLEFTGRRVKDITVRGRTEGSGWSAEVAAVALAGELTYRARPQPRFVARLARFTVPEEGPPRGARPVPAGELPSLDFVAREFTLRGKPLGRVELVTSPAGEDMHIEKVSMVNPEASFTGTGTWHGGARPRTRLQFELEAGDSGGFLARVGQPGMVKGGRTQMQGALAWNGDPATLDFASLRGDLQMQVQDGQFLEIEPGIGKLIGLMSLQALPRRITLDFSDVFSKGFRFDRINAAARIDDGALKLREFRMRGSAADVEMTGDVDLVRETQDLRVRVLPSLGDSAALGIGIVNPVAGVAAAIAQRILKNPLGQIFSFDYKVSGGWTDPKVEKILPPPPPEHISN
ncbi:MAG TPA: YhdP family protein, partial [Burkholderiales bacterium]|nr:YhdP family protein [Burkholderiales bacterium]